MNSIQFVIVFFLVLPFISEAQKTWHPESYYGISDDFKMLIICENFTYPSENWKQLNYSGRSAVFSDGKYQLRASTRSLRIQNPELSFPLDADFEVNIQCTIHKGTQLVFEHFLSEISFFNDKKSMKKLLESRKKTFSLSFRKIGHDAYFFINKQFVRSEKNIELPKRLFLSLPYPAEIDLHSIDIFLVNKIFPQEISENYSVKQKEHSKKENKNFSKIALIIGNSNYSNGNYLKNPVNDADSITERLNSLNFKTVKRTNLTLSELNSAFTEFQEVSKDYDVKLIYYAGHGVQINGINYLIPIDANPKTSSEAIAMCLRADAMIPKREGSEINIVILDACRDNPFSRKWNSDPIFPKGLSPMNAPSGSFIAYATSPGGVASDGGNENGLFTESLLKYICSPDIDIFELFMRVRKDVIKKSNNMQVPWETSSLCSSFYFSE